MDDYELYTKKCQIADGTVATTKYREPTDAQRQAALDALNRLHAYSDYYGCSLDFETVSAALQSPHDNAIEPISFVCWEENGVRLKTRHGEFIVTTPKQSPLVPVIEGLDEAISYNEGSLRATLQHARMIVKNHDAFPNTPLFLKLQAEETIKNSEMGLKLIEAARAYVELQSPRYAIKGAELNDKSSAFETDKAYAELSKTKASGALDSASIAARCVEPSSAPPQKGV